MPGDTNCPGVRDDDSVRPIPMCQSCQHWRSTIGERITPLIQLRHDGQRLIVLCGRRQAVKAEG